MRSSLILILLVLCSCHSGSKNEVKFESTFGMYGLMIEEYNYSIHHLRNEIEKDMIYVREQKDENSKEIICDILTDDYSMYLDNIIDKLVNTSRIQEIDDNQHLLMDTQYTNNYFYEDSANSVYNSNGLEFIEKTNWYRNSMLELVSDQNMKDLLLDLYNTENVADRNSNSIKSLDYLFKDQSLIGTIAYLKMRIQNTLEIERQFLANSLSNY